jgi:formyltetrahydrofolate hydrolase
MTVKEGYFSDDGTEIDQTTVPTPSLCLSCLKNNDATEEVICMITRMDQMKDVKNGERFLCFSYDPNDPSINKKQALRDMDKYMMEQNRKYLAQKKNRNKKTMTLVSKKTETP